jgi:hypothetical protein
LGHGGRESPESFRIHPAGRLPGGFAVAAACAGPDAASSAADAAFEQAPMPGAGPDGARGEAAPEAAAREPTVADGPPDASRDTAAPVAEPRDPREAGAANEVPSGAYTVTAELTIEPRSIPSSGWFNFPTRVAFVLKIDAAARSFVVGNKGVAERARYEVTADGAVRATSPVAISPWHGHCPERSAARTCIHWLRLARPTAMPGPEVNAYSVGWCRRQRHRG